MSGMGRKQALASVPIFLSYNPDFMPAFVHRSPAGRGYFSF